MPYPDLFRLAVDASACGIVICDEAGCILFTNPALERLFGYTSGELLGLPIDNLVPEAFRGAPLALVTAGLMALAFMGFGGLVGR